jgi:signal transduction histidine kinase
MLQRIEKRVLRWPWQIILLVCILGSVGLFALSEISYYRVSKDYAAALDSTKTFSQLGRLARKLSEAESAQRGFLMTQNPQYLEPYTAALPTISSLGVDLSQRYSKGDSEGGAGVLDERIHSILDRVDNKAHELDLTIRLAKQGKWDSATSILRAGNGNLEMQRIRTMVEELQKEEGAKTALGIENVRISLQLSRLTIGGLAALNVVLLILVTLWLRRESRQASAREAALDITVHERTEQLAQLASHLQEVSETEKLRLGRELHDELGAILMASKLDLAWIEPRLTKDQKELSLKLRRARKNLDQGILIKRRIIEDLRPTTLANFGLVTAARELIELAAERANWKLELDFPETDPDLSEEAEITLFRILQESVTNIAKYAKASRVRVSLLYAQGEVCRLEIEDNGIGFRHTDIRPKAAGLMGMRERLRARGGRLDIESGPGQGTLIRALLPLAADATTTALKGNGAWDAVGSNEPAVSSEPVVSSKPLPGHGATAAST